MATIERVKAMDALGEFRRTLYLMPLSHDQMVLIDDAASEAVSAARVDGRSQRYAAEIAFLKGDRDAWKQCSFRDQAALHILLEEVARISSDYIPRNDSENALALSEMREALIAAVEDCRQRTGRLKSTIPTPASPRSPQPPTVPRNHD